MGRSHFVMFGASHLAVLALTVLLPLLLSAAARHRSAADRLVRWGIAAILTSGWICWYLLSAHRGNLQSVAAI